MESWQTKKWEIGEKRLRTPVLAGPTGKTKIDIIGNLDLQIAIERYLLKSKKNLKLLNWKLQQFFDKNFVYFYTAQDILFMKMASFPTSLIISLNSLVNSALKYLLRLS